MHPQCTFRVSLAVLLVLLSVNAILSILLFVFFCLLVLAVIAVQVLQVFQQLEGLFTVSVQIRHLTVEQVQALQFTQVLLQTNRKKIMRRVQALESMFAFQQLNLHSIGDRATNECNFTKGSIVSMSLILFPLRFRCVRFGQFDNKLRPADILLSLSSS